MEPGKASRKSSAWLHAEDFKDFRQRAWSWRAIKKSCPVPLQDMGRLSRKSFPMYMMEVLKKIALEKFL
jgi:hypothetical protein